MRHSRSSIVDKEKKNPSADASCRWNRAIFRISRLLGASRFVGYSLVHRVATAVLFWTVKPYAGSIGWFGIRFDTQVPTM